MNRWKLGVAVAVSCLAAWGIPSPARALVIAPPPGPTRVMNANMVIVGKVVGIEPQDVPVMNVTYRIAVVQVKETIRGDKEAKMVRVGFVPPPMGGKGPLIRPGGFRGVQLQVGNDGLFLLSKHPSEKFLILGGPIGSFVSSENNAGFEKDVQAVKAITKVAANPAASLKSKDAEERLLAASVLIENYRVFRGPGQPKQEAIDAAESKLILLAIADADWKAQAGFGSFRPNPVNLFFRLGIGPKDGWQPAPGANVQALMPTWLRDNAEKFRIQRFVAGDTK